MSELHKEALPVEDFEQPPVGPDQYADDTPPTDLIKVYFREIGRVPLLTAEDEVRLCKQIEAGMLASHLLGIQDGGTNMTAEITPKDVELAAKYLPERENLMILQTEGKAAKEKMLESNLKLVVSIAKRYTGKGLDLLDLIQEGNLGLVRAVEKFDYEKGFKFSTYATWWIRQSVSRGLSESARTIRLPTHMAEQVTKYTRTERQMVQALGRNATHAEMAKELDISIARAKELEEYARHPLELDRIIGDDGDASLGDFIEDTNAIRPDEMVVSQDLNENIRTAIDKLDPRMAFILKRRYGLDTGTVATLDEVGHDLGLTRERIRQIQTKAEGMLKKLFLSMGISAPSS